MVGLPSVLAAALLSVSVLAQPVYVSTPRPISVVRTGLTSGASSPIIGSNGESFLLSWYDDRISSNSISNQTHRSSVLMRVGADGAPLDELPLALPFGVAGITWTGKEWVAAGWDGVARISAEGELLGMRTIDVAGFSGRSPRGPQAPVVATPTGTRWLYTLPLRPACDTNGCWVAGVSRDDRERDTPGLYHYEDDGTQVTIRRHDVANLTYFSPCDNDPIVPSILNAARPVLLYLPQQMERPFASVHRVMIAPLTSPKSRAVRH